MQQRVYRGGTGTPAGVADFLVQQFAQTRRQRAQVFGEGGAVLVQIGREGRAPALTVGIAHPPQDMQDIVVTMGEREWATSSASLYGTAGTLVGALFTPWALFGLLGPLKHTLDANNVPQEVWGMIETYLIGQGAMLVSNQQLQPPPVG